MEQQHQRLLMKAEVILMKFELKSMFKCIDCEKIKSLWFAIFFFWKCNIKVEGLMKPEGLKDYFTIFFNNQKGYLCIQMPRFLDACCYINDPQPEAFASLEDASVQS